MPSYNFFRHNPTDNAIGILQGRRQLWQQGRVSDHIKTQRNNAYAKVSIGGRTLPVDHSTFDSTYVSPGPKPYPSLDSVNIKLTGEFGHAIHVDVYFTCYLKSHFVEFDKAWLRPGQKGQITFGYVKPWGNEQTAITLKDLHVAMFDFNTDQAGHYICHVMLVGASKMLEAVEMKGGLKSRGKFKYKTKSIFGNIATHEVTSLDELLLYDAQENGRTPTDDLPDNYKVANPFGDIIIYEPPSKAGVTGALQRTAGKLAGIISHSGDKQWTYFYEYYSLKYIVDRLVNDQILGFLRETTSGKDAQTVNKLKIVCNESVSRGVGYNILRSANPLALLILGGGRGTYKSPDGAGKDWENDGAGGGATIQCHRGDFIDLSKLMFERTVITTALAHSREGSESQPSSQRTNVSEKTPVLIYAERFLRELFKTVSYNTGNLIQMDLVENPNNRYELLVIDRNNGETPPIQVFKFNPIDGDGSTRNMQISSNAGSRDYMAAMFGNVIKQSDINSTIKGDIGDVDGKRNIKFATVIQAIKKKVNETLPDSGFETDEIEGLATLFVEYNQCLPSSQHKKKQVTLYPGLNINVTIDGVWGFDIGSHITTTLLPDTPYLIAANGLCFSIQEVQHTINVPGGNWETTLSGPLAFANPIVFV